MSTISWGFPNTAAVTANELGNTWQYKEVQTTAAQLLNSWTSPIELLPALTGNQYYVYNIHALFTMGTSDYVVDYWFVSPNSFLAQVAGPPPGTIIQYQTTTWGAATDTNESPGAALVNGTPLGAGQQVEFLGDNAGGNPTGGNGTFKFKIWYQVYEA
jgi:hypothetical protein